ncbi:MAG: hypothetical protein QOG53_2557 [Frankiales bacterium]|jgi:hypothetical protein|nr:hypothetical protein [Frankiales bacterium]
MTLVTSVRCPECIAPHFNVLSDLNVMLTGYAAPRTR